MTKFSLPHIISGCVLNASLLMALTTRAGDSSPAYNYLNIPSSSLIYGLGGINISTITDDVNSIDQNPALLGPEFEKQIGLNYMRYIANSNFAGARFASSAGEHGAWGIGIQYYGYGEMDLTDISGNINGSFSPKDITFSGVYSHDITETLRGGINLKFLYSSYGEYTAMAIATDLGINYYDAERDLSLSAVIANLGGQVKRFDQRYNRLPVDIRLGWTKSFGSLPIRFSVTAWNLTKWKLPYYETGDGTENSEPELKDSFGSNLFRHLIFAADFVPSEKFHIGIGYNYKTRTDMATYSRSFLSGFSVGAGLNVKSFGIGIALSQPHSGATTFMFNLSTNLSELL
ncbi:MAG: type IX secretion system protein PorQ [Firmicutes bacterium]|nr:type IX secretion system protein PorQ [Bacillota bacterium]MCM1401108.1 type IX secretion system protein PorQ [Bacteroides sp.]MCM1477069.1 type IX secretion system protein PorQ [Bacteroides sp.]